MSQAISSLPSRAILPDDARRLSAASDPRHALLGFLNRKDAAGLLAYLNRYELTSLDCSGIPLTADHVAVIKTVLSDPKLLITEINLAATMIGKDHALSIVEAIQSNAGLHIRSIDFSTCDLRDDGANAIINALKHNNSLKAIDLYDNHIGPDCVPALVEMLDYGCVKTLNLERNHLGPVSQKTLLAHAYPHAVQVLLGNNKKELSRSYAYLSGLSLTARNILLTRPHIRAFLELDAFPGDDSPTHNIGLFLGTLEPQPDLSTQIVEVALFCSEHEPKAVTWFNEMIACAAKTALSLSECLLDENVVHLAKWLATNPPITELEIAIDSDYKYTNLIAYALRTNTKLNSLTIDTSLGATLKHERFNPSEFVDAFQENKSLTYFFVKMDFEPIALTSASPRAKAKELFVQEWPDRHHKFAGEIWELVHRNAVNRVPISVSQRGVTDLCNVPPDVAGLLLRHVLDHYPDPGGKEAKMMMLELAFVAKELKAKKKVINESDQ